MFKANEASAKGGALRYISRNFTTVYAEEDTGRRMLFDGAEHGEPKFVDTNSYVENQAAQSDEIASYPGSFKYKVE